MMIVLLSAGTIHPAAAQTTGSDQTQPISGTNGSAADLRISPRLGVSHHSSGGGYDGVTQLEGFIPLRQTPGENLTFLEGDLRVDNGGHWGGSLALGHRIYDEQNDRIWGGYLAADHRQTDDSSFYQLGVGLESLGEVVDFRINGYLPIGDTSNLLSEQTFDSGNQISTGFQGHQLMLTNERTRQTTQLWESALGGFDAEVGARVARWKDGDLRAFGGVYYYGGAHSDDAFGWRLRLEANPNDHLHLGAAIQNDDLFGTNVSVSVGVTWPRIHPRAQTPEQETVALRLGEPTVRNPNIIVNQEQEVDTQTDRTERPLMNPEEERPYRFQHVTLGRKGGDGTFERPFGSVQAALDATRSDGNDVVYIDRGNNSDIPAFTIPNRVQVLSQAPVQVLAGMPFPGFPSRPVRLPFSPTENFNNGILVRLPLSNDGRFPNIREAGATNLVTLGDRTTLAGFHLSNATENGIIGQNIADVELRDNTIRNAGRGIFLEDVSDSVILFDNTIVNSTGGAGSGQGILIQDSINDSVEVTMERQQLRNNRVGLEIAASGEITQQQGSSQTVSITGSTIENNHEQGLQLSAENFGNQVVSFQNGTIRNNGSQGVQIQAVNSGSQEVTIEQSTISQNGSDGIRMEGGVLNGSGTAAQEAYIRNNTISENGGDGIRIIGNEVVAQEAGIDGNQIQNNRGAGIRGTSNNVSFLEYVTDADNNSNGISNNIITGNGDQGIDLNANNRGTIIADIKDNRSENNQTGGRPDIDVTSSSNNTDICVVVNNNSVPSGIRLDNNSILGVAGLFEVGDLSTVSTRNIGQVEFLPNTTAFTNKPGARSCFE